MRPNEVIDGLAELRRHAGDPDWCRIMNESVSRAAKTKEDHRFAEQLGQVDIDGTFQVSQDMCELVEHLLVQFNSEDVFRHDFAPTYNGFVQFERSIKLQTKDTRDGTVGVMHASWLMWAHVTSPLSRKHSLFIVAFSNPRRDYGRDWIKRYSDPDLYKEDIAEDLRNTVGSFLYSGIEAMDDYEQFPDDPTQSVGMRTLKALWMLLSQRIAVLTPRHLERHAARRAKKLNLPTSVTVIQLRSLEYTGADNSSLQHESREYSVRWMVRGHTAWRKCSEHHPGAEPYEKGWRVRVYIHPYAKNAEYTDLPWKMGKIVHILDR